MIAEYKAANPLPSFPACFFSPPSSSSIPPSLTPLAHSPSPTMSDTKDELHDQDHGKVEKVEVHQDEVLANPDLMNDAFEGENLEHQMGAWEAFKKHPWACFWAFMMCFTIVSFQKLHSRNRISHLHIADPKPPRSWNPSTCS